MRKLNMLLNQCQKDAAASQKNSAWIVHYQLQRGNPVRIYEGTDFRRKK